MTYMKKIPMIELDGRTPGLCFGRPFFNGKGEKGVEARNIAVVGGGPAGMLAAATAAERGHKVVLFEKNDRLGKKLRITGKGRCNMTNSADVEELIRNVPVHGNFLYSAFYTFSNDRLLELLHNLGLETKVERGGRVFPASDNAQDVVDTLKKYLRQTGVKVVHAEVEAVQNGPGGKKTVRLPGGKGFLCDRVVIATGGASYPQTGSTGDGYRFARNLGHTVTPLKPSLVPLELVEPYGKELQGLSLRNIAIKVLENGKAMYDDFGEMLFTHFGVSGPVILSASSHMRRDADYILAVDLKPALDRETLDKRILRDFEQEKNKDFANALDKLLPKKLIPLMVRLSEIDPHKKVHSVTREERRTLVELLKNFQMHVKGFRPLKEAIVTSGGVAVGEVDPSTMESKIVPGLFFAGEVIDVDAYTGGFNLQIAFSTGFLAGKNV